MKQDYQDAMLEILIRVANLKSTTPKGIDLIMDAKSLLLSLGVDWQTKKAA